MRKLNLKPLRMTNLKMTFPSFYYRLRIQSSEKSNRPTNLCFVVRRSMSIQDLACWRVPGSRACVDFQIPPRPPPPHISLPPPLLSSTPLVFTTDTTPLICGKCTPSSSLTFISYTLFITGTDEVAFTIQNPVASANSTRVLIIIYKPVLLLACRGGHRFGSRSLYHPFPPLFLLLLCFSLLATRLSVEQLFRRSPTFYPLGLSVKFSLPFSLLYPLLGRPCHPRGRYLRFSLLKKKHRNDRKKSHRTPIPVY